MSKISIVASSDIDVQRILQSDWMRGTPGHTQPKVVLADLHPKNRDIDSFFPDLHAIDIRYELILSRNIDDQKIL